MPGKAKVLIVDDEAVVCNNCRRILTAAGYDAHTLQSSRIAVERIKEEPFDLALIDMRMPGYDGMKLLSIIKEHRPETAVIIITGYSAVENAVEALKLGAADYISKPFTPDELTLRVERALEKKNLQNENVMLHKELGDRYDFSNIVGSDRKMRAVFGIIKKVAPTDSTVLITGGSGSGKELVARAIHYNSLRKEGRFVSIDCGALAENLLESELFGHVKGSFTGAISSKPGLFEAAAGGTVFLDEISNMSVSTQAKLLRALQEREVKPVGSVKAVKIDVRIIAATNVDIEGLINQGRFREDLYYRINIVPISLPDLKDRRDDIPLLAGHFLKEYNRISGKEAKRITPDAMKLLENYSWPGNVRELENVIERVVVLAEGREIKPVHLPEAIQKCESPVTAAVPRNGSELKKIKKLAREEAVVNIEKMFVVEALKRNGWNITKAARSVKMQRQNFQLLVKKYQIKP